MAGRNTVQREIVLEELRGLLERPEESFAL